ncbi:hypothetical protein MMC07_005961 [Pseudocyphellaria aurata]|nr:hypothetical protein [Pseudocyphellaria aurata]
MYSTSARALVRSATKSKFIIHTLACGPRSTRSLATRAGSRQKDPVDLGQITTLSNGIRVATEALPAPFSGVGIYLSAGSRYENEELRGVSHIADRLAFKVDTASQYGVHYRANENMQSTRSRTSDLMLESLEMLGGNIQCASSRESLMYQATSFNSTVPNTLGLLAETIRYPMITELEVQQQLETAEIEINEIWSKPELILPELVNTAAFKDNTLGNPLLCPLERLPFINKAVLEKYRSVFFRPERMIVAFVGVNHEVAVKHTEKYFGDMENEQAPTLSGTGLNPSFTDPETVSQSRFSSFTSSSVSPATTPPAPSTQTSRFLSSIPFLKNLSTSASPQASVSSIMPSHPTAASLDLAAPSHYTGGFISLPPIPRPLNPSLPHLSYIHLAFEAPSISSPDIYALATLQALLGGGGSFSAGGPGKGMYSRLYTNVLNQHGWVDHCVAFNHSYSDSGLFGISASCAPNRVAEMLDVMCRELQNLTLDTGFSALQSVEINRAKNQLKSALLMNLESRMIELEDLGRQIQVHGRKVGVQEMCAQINALTVDDLKRVARQVLGGGLANVGKGTGAPTVVLQEGQLSGLRRQELKWNQIQEMIARWKLGRRQL